MALFWNSGTPGPAVMRPPTPPRSKAFFCRLGRFSLTRYPVFLVRGRTLFPGKGVVLQIGLSVLYVRNCMYVSFNRDAAQFYFFTCSLLFYIGVNDHR